MDAGRFMSSDMCESPERPSHSVAVPAHLLGRARAPAPLPPALVLPPPFDYSAAYDLTPYDLTTPRLTLPGAGPRAAQPPSRLSHLGSMRQPNFASEPEPEPSSPTPEYACSPTSDGDDMDECPTHSGALAHPPRSSSLPPLSRSGSDGLPPPVPRGAATRAQMLGGVRSSAGVLHQAYHSESMLSDAAAAACSSHPYATRSSRNASSPIEVPAAPRKKPPASPPVHLQGAATASASKCRERLAIAARMHRTSQRSSIDMATTPTPLHAMESQGAAAPLERNHTFTGTRKRLDDTLDDVMGSQLVTPKRMRVAEELFSKMNI